MFLALMRLEIQIFREDVREIDKALNDSVEKTNKILNEVMGSIHIGEPTLLGILAQDTKALYLGMVTNAVTELGQRRIQLVVMGSTLVNGKHLNLMRTTDYEGVKTISELVAETQAWVSLVHDSN